MFSGHIDADSGTIGKWKIEDGKLVGGNNTIVLDAEGETINKVGYGIIKIGKNLTLKESNSSIIAENLSIYGDLGRINIGKIGEIYIDGLGDHHKRGFANIGISVDITNEKYKENSNFRGPILTYTRKTINGVTNWQEIGGLGFVYGSDDGKNSTYNIGMKTTDSDRSIILESAKNIRLTTVDTVYIAGNKIEFIGAAGSNPENQTGIYARFA
mgnify:CR=1 FL=1